MNVLSKCYSVCPGVAPVGEPVEMAVIPLESKHIFRPDLEYEVYLYPLVNKRAAAAAEPDFILSGEGGALRFRYAFEQECEYFIRIFNRTGGVKGTKIVQLTVYALRGDLFSRRPLKGDLHIHSSRSDGAEEPAAVAANYRGYGMDFISLTDHNRYFPSLEMKDAYAGVKLGITFINGEEVHTPVSNLHIVHVGGESSVAELYVKHKEQYESEVAEIEAALPESELSARYAARLARMKWAADKIHEAGGIAIYPHPYWISDVNNIEDEFSNMIFKSGLFDAYELVGGMETDGINLSVAFYNDLRAEGLSIPVVGSSDAHTTNQPSGRSGSLYTLVWAEDNTPGAIVKAIREGYCAAVEASPESGEYRVYGSYRFVSFARYLIDWYFPVAGSIVAAEGVFMRRHLYGDTTAAAVLNSISDSGEKFYDYFYGRKPGFFPDNMLPESRLAFVDKWNKVWQEYGVLTKGSNIV